MKNITSLVLSASFFCLVGCSETTKETSTETSSTQTSEAASSTELTASDLEASAPQTSASAVTEMPAAAAPASNVSIATPAGMNPPHGQPGHDCAIAVGAPLNSSGKAPNSLPQISTSQEAVQPSNTPTLTAPSPTTVSTPAGMNPPHGQPGHDCAVAVGAPLKK